MLKLPVIVPTEDRSIISVIFPLDIDRHFLDTVRKDYEINGQYGVLGLDNPIINGGEVGGYLVIFYSHR